MDHPEVASVGCGLGIVMVHLEQDPIRSNPVGIDNPALGTHANLDIHMHQLSQPYLKHSNLFSLKAQIVMSLPLSSHFATS